VMLWRVRPDLAWLAFAPAIVNFAMFSLRDPLILAIVFLAAASFCDPNRAQRWIGQIVALMGFLLIRPELAVIFLLANAGREAWDARMRFWSPLAVVMGLLNGWLALGYAPRALGLEMHVSVLDLPLVMGEFFQMRAERWDSFDGGGSNILGGGLSEMAFLPRYLVQLTSFFVLPLPFEIDHWLLAFAFLDSAVACALVWRAHRQGNRAGLTLFWAYVLAVSLFSSNYGNLFRMRLPAYGILLASLTYSGRRAHDV